MVCPFGVTGTTVDAGPSVCLPAVVIEHDRELYDWG